MSSQNWNNPSDPNQPYEPPAGQGGYQPPQPGAYQPPAQPTQPPAQQGYQPPAAQPYQAPGAPYQAPGQQPAPYGAPYQQPAQGFPGTPVVAGGQLAGWGTRALGGLIDYVVPGIILSMASSPFGPDPRTGVIRNAVLYYLFGTILPIVWWVFNSGWKQGTTGQTFGKQIAKTKLVSEATGQPIGFGMAVVRHLVHIVDTVICLVGWLFPLWDAKRQTLADKIMKTVVVKTN